MAWVAPKTSWNPTDGVADTDFERIEGNIDYLKDERDTNEERIHLCGSYPNTLSCPASSTTTLALVLRDIPDQKKLVLKRISWSAGGTGDLKARAFVVTGSSYYTAAGYRGDDSGLSTDLYSNTSGSAVEKNVGVGLRNDTGGAINADQCPTVLALIDLEDV